MTLFSPYIALIPYGFVTVVAKTQSEFHFYFSTKSSDAFWNFVLTILCLKLLDLPSCIMKEGVTGVLVLLAFRQPSTGVLLELKKIKLILKKEPETKL